MKSKDKHISVVKEKSGLVKTTPIATVVDIPSDSFMTRLKKGKWSAIFSRKILYIVVFVIAVIIAAVVFLLLDKSDNTSTKEELNSIMQAAPEDPTQRKEWSKTISQRLEANEDYKTGDKQEQTDYYNKLISLYYSQQSPQKAGKLYIEQIKPKAIIVNSSMLLWLKDYFVSMDDIVNTKNILDDLVLIYQQEIDTTKLDTDKQQLQVYLDKLNQEKKALQ